MTVVIEADAVLHAPAIPAPDAQEDAAETLEEIIASHRQALRELAPHQAERSVRKDTAWHITQLGLLLRVRGAVHAAAEQQKAPAGLVQRPQGHGENTGTDHHTR